MSTLAYLIRRAGHHWPVLAALALGVVLATGLLAVSPMLVDTVLEFGLRRQLLDAEPVGAHVRLFRQSEPDQLRQEFLDRRVRALVEAQLSGQVARIIPAGGSRWFFPWLDGELTTDQRVNLRFYDQSAPVLLEQAAFTDGRHPPGRTTGARRRCRPNLCGGHSAPGWKRFMPSEMSA